MRTKRKSCGLRVANFIRYFDIFGARPNFCGGPYNYTPCGCLITLLIIVLAILTFALTMHNMSKTRLELDKTYIFP